MLGNIKAAFKLFILLVWIAICFVFLALAFQIKKTKWCDNVMRVGCMGVLRIIGIRVTVTGHVSDVRPLLLASNHISYLDVWILNACAHVHFTPKIEISRWPVVKHIVRMSGSIYVDRRSDKIVEARQKLLSALLKGNIICLFPEATTGNGVHMMPFKSGFFSLAEEKIDGRELAIQPVAVNYTSIRKLPIDMNQWPLIAWYGDMVLMPHLWELLKITPIDAEVAFLGPVTLEEHGDRKKLASHCHRVIHEAIQTMRSSHRHRRQKPASFHPRLLRIKKQ